MTSCAFALFAAPVAFADEKPPLRAGAAKADITPKKWPQPMVGSFSERLAEKAFDPLYVRAIVLDLYPVTRIDSSGYLALREVVERLSAQGVRFAVAGRQARLQSRMQELRVSAADLNVQLFPSLSEAVERLGSRHEGPAAGPQAG